MRHSAPRNSGVIAKTTIMATARLLYGYIGSSKTTHELEHSLRARFTHDDWMFTLYRAD